MTTPTTPYMTDETSQIIRTGRVLCILFMMTVHVWPGGGRILGADVPGWQHVFFVVVVDHFGRAAVPLLGVFSGLLMGLVYTRASKLSAIVGKKAMTLIAPIAFWSVPLIVMSFGANVVLGASEPVPVTLLDWLNALIGLIHPPANSPLHFLRDVFVMSIVALIILWFCTINRAFAVAVSIAFLYVQFWYEPFLLRSQIGLFYLAGLFLAVFGRVNWRPTLLLALAALALSEGVEIWLPETLTGTKLEHTIRIQLPRVSMAMIMWWLCWRSLSSPAINRAMNRLERHIFVVFCSHSITIKFFALIAQKTGLSENTASYVLVFLVQIPLCVLVGVILSHILRNVPVANGGRKPARR